MAEIDYPKLSRRQKLAVFLIVIGPEAAAEVLKQFDDPETEAVCREMTGFTVIPEPIQKQVVDELSGILNESKTSALGGLAYARRTLELAKGGQKASSMLGPGATSSESPDIMKQIGRMEGRQIFNMIRFEQPQTISFVLSYLESTKASEVFALLPGEVKDAVVERLGTIESTPVDLASKIVRRLEKHLDTKEKPALHRSGGVDFVAGLLKQLDKDTSKNLLVKMEERNATLGAAVRRKMFSFEDLMRLQASDLQRILRETDSGGLAVAMKGASEPMRQKIYGSLSKRAAASLKEEIELLGPVRVKDVEAAQDTIIQSVQRLEEAGEISTDAGGAQALVA